MTQNSPSPAVWTFKPAADRSDLQQVGVSTQLNVDDLRKVFGRRIERTTHTGEPVQFWKWGQLAAVMVSPEWFRKANELMREAGLDHASDEYDPLPARSDSPKR